MSRPFHRNTVVVFFTAVFISLSTQGAQGASPAPPAMKTVLPSVDVKKLKREIDRHMREGKRYYNLKKYNLAIYEWELALSLDPQNPWIPKYIQDAKQRIERTTRSEVTLINVVAPLKEEMKILSLDECVAIAVANHIPLQVAAKNQRLSEARLWEARRNLFPKVTMMWEETYGKVNARRYYGQKDQIEGQHTVYKGGELVYVMKQAEINLEVAKHEYAKTRNEIVLQVKKAYYALAKSKENLRLQTALHDEVGTIFERVRKQYDAGVAAKLELLNVTSQASQVDFQFVSAKGDVDMAALILKQVMNLNPRDPVDIKPRLLFMKCDVDAARLLQIAFINRPEMKINSLTLKYYDYEKRVARAKFFPKIDLMGSWGKAKEEYIAKDNMPKTYDRDSTDRDQKMGAQWYAGFKASMPIMGSTTEYSFTQESWQPVVSAYQGTIAQTKAVKISILDKLQNYSDKIAAEMDYDRARQEFNKIRQDISLEVEEGCFNYEKNVIQLETSRHKVAYQEKDLELTKYKRALDEIQDSAVIESMIKLAQERYGYQQALADYHSTVATLNKAIGIDDLYRIEEAVTR